MDSGTAVCAQGPLHTAVAPKSHGTPFPPPFPRPPSPFLHDIPPLSNASKCFLRLSRTGETGPPIPCYKTEVATVRKETLATQAFGRSQAYYPVHRQPLRSDPFGLLRNIRLVVSELPLRCEKKGSVGLAGCFFTQSFEACV